MGVTRAVAGAGAPQSVPFLKKVNQVLLCVSESLTVSDHVIYICIKEPYCRVDIITIINPMSERHIDRIDARFVSFRV